MPSLVSQSKLVALHSSRGLYTSAVILQPQETHKTTRNTSLYNEHGHDIELVAVNDLTDPETLKHLFEFDSVMGRLGADVTLDGDMMTVNGHQRL